MIALVSAEWFHYEMIMKPIVCEKKGKLIRGFFPGT